MATATKTAPAADVIVHERDVLGGKGNIHLVVRRTADGRTFANFDVELTRAIGRPKSATHNKDGSERAVPKDRVAIATNGVESYLVTEGDMYWSLNVSAKGDPKNWPPKV